VDVVDVDAPQIVVAKQRESEFSPTPLKRSIRSSRSTPTARWW